MSGPLALTVRYQSDRWGDDLGLQEIEYGIQMALWKWGQRRSARELGLSEDHSCLLELPADAPVGEDGAGLDELLRKRAELIMAMCRSALPYLKKSPAGRIINMGFLRSFFAADGGEAAAKAEQDLANLTRALAAETGEFGITANYIQPGGVMTPESRDTFRKNPGLRDFCIKASAARRLGEPVDVAKVALFLASDDAVFVSGTGIAVDGGRAAD